MDQVITFIISAIIFLFGVLVFITQFHDSADILDENQIRTNIETIADKLNKFCSDPFSGDNFEFDYHGKYQIYSKEDKICAADNADFIYCSKTNCNNPETEILGPKSFESTYVCKIKKIDNIMTLDCQT